MSDAVLTKTEAEEMTTLVKSMRDKFQEYGKNSIDFKNYQEKLDVDLKKLDDKHDEMVKDQALAKKKEDEAIERIKHLESTVAMARNINPIKTSPHSVFNALIKKDWFALCESDEPLAKDYVDNMKTRVSTFGDLPQEAKGFANQMKTLGTKASPDLLRTDIGEFGGFLTPVAWSTELLKQIVETSPVRAFARVKTLAGKTLMQPIRQGIPTAYWEGEAEAAQSSISNYTTEELTTHRLHVNIPVTHDELNDNAYNLSQGIIDDGKLAFAQAEGRGFINGTGNLQPLGFAQDANVPIYESATSTIGFKDVIKLTGELKSGYNAQYFFNRRTLNYLRTLEDQNDRFLWAGPFGDAATGTPATINGERYSSGFIDMDDVDTALGTPILYADFRQFYCIADRKDVVIIRDDVTQKLKAIVEITMFKWATGQVIVKEAGILLKRKAV